MIEKGENKMNNQLNNVNEESMEMKTFFENLESKMREYRFLSDNPVVKRIKAGKGSKQFLVETVNDYAGLVVFIVPFLAKAQYSLKKFPEIVKELKQNISGERGAKTQGITHHDLLNRGLLLEKEITICKNDWTNETLEFLYGIDEAMHEQKKNPSFVAGMIYALEDSATPELAIIVTQLLSAIQSDSTAHAEISLKDFVQMHTEDFEPGHRDRFAEAVAGYLGSGALSQKEFTAGFITIMDMMEVWWQELAQSQS